MKKIIMITWLAAMLVVLTSCRERINVDSSCVVTESTIEEQESTVATREDDIAHTETIDISASASASESTEGATTETQETTGHEENVSANKDLSGETPED